jgi:hypothetical protein
VTAPTVGAKKHKGNIMKVALMTYEGDLHVYDEWDGVVVEDLYARLNEKTGLYPCALLIKPEDVTEYVRRIHECKAEAEQLRRKEYQIKVEIHQRLMKDLA